ncbi:nuclear transport factor 2 family protein [Bordetella sp. N]|uniref:nuclear transport factor 2 family protein n=1 Tax=Bordetella sp. N TaxID=1746199 RepID=UPI000710F3F7|nr:nuclear transport factor 2 family protein [Bordetella sp. N]ALM84101.1 hypothetical protein ASB57_14960 [Bordetella sp. N]
MITEISKIEAAVQLYFDGLYEGSVEKLAQVFHEGATLFIPKEGKLVALPVPEWFKRVAARPAPAASKASRDDAILLIDRVGEANAMVKVRCMLPPTTYTDYLSFIKFDGRWQIVAKSYCEIA